MIHSITINGKEIPVLFGMHLTQVLTSETVENGQMTASLFLTYLIYYGHENYCLGNDKPKMVKRSEVFNWVQSVDTPEDLKQTEEILQAYTDSQEFKKIQEFGKVAEGAKKKAVGKLAGVKSGALHSESSDLDQASIIDSQNGTTTSL